MLTIVLAYKTKNRRKEVPEVVYFGHDKNEAKACQVPEGYQYVETSIIQPGYGRKWAKDRVDLEKATAQEKAEKAAEEKAAEEKAAEEKAAEEKAAEEKAAEPGVKKATEEGSFQKITERNASDGEGEEVKDAPEDPSKSQAAEEEPKLLDTPPTRSNKRGGSKKK